MTSPDSWSRGYPVGDPYPASWHFFQSPAHLRAICALMGVAWDVGPHRPLSIADIGCGTGYSTNMLAAGGPNWQVLGLDYNPAHIAEAQGMADAAGLANVRFLEADLAELDDAELDRLPPFDLVTVHGVWSWVADSVREGVLRLLRRRLKPGGLALVSYNALPGAAGALGLARLVRGAIRAGGSNLDGVGAARTLVNRLVAAEAAHLPQSTWRRALTDDSGGVRLGYLLHEFLTEHWRPSFFADVADSLASARCQFVGSATIDENFPQLSLSAPQRELWNEASDDTGRQLLMDLCVPRAFRRDLFVRGVRRVPRDVAIDALWVASATHATSEAAFIAQAVKVALPTYIVDPVRAALARGPQTIGSLRALSGCDKVTAPELLAVLVGAGAAAPLWRQPEIGADWAQALASARRLNSVAAERFAPHGVGAGTLGLASPALGGGLPATALELAVARLTAESAATDAASDDVRDLARRLLPLGPPPDATILAELESAIAVLLRDRGPVWRALGIT